MRARRRRERILAPVQLPSDEELLRIKSQRAAEARRRETETRSARHEPRAGMVQLEVHRLVRDEAFSAARRCDGRRLHRSWLRAESP